MGFGAGFNHSTINHLVFLFFSSQRLCQTPIYRVLTSLPSKQERIGWCLTRRQQQNERGTQLPETTNKMLRSLTSEHSLELNDQLHSADTAYRCLQEGLDQELCNINAALEAFRALASVEISRLRYQRNALSPISSLPVETMVSILLESVGNRELDGECKSRNPICLVRLSSVCRKWRSILEGTPKFWTRLDTRDPVAFVQMALGRTKDYPIALFGPIDGGYLCPAANTNFHNVTAQMNQLETVDLTFEYDDDLSLLTSKPAARLKTLVLSCNTGKDFDTPNLFIGETPCLESVIFTRFRILWSSPMWRNLLSLQLEMIVGPDIDHFADILEACPGLHTLSLVDVDFGYPENHNSTRSSAIFLPSLRKMSLEPAGTIDLLAQLLGRLQCPTLAVFEINLTDLKLEPEDIEYIATFSINFLHRVNPHLVVIYEEEEFLFQAVDPHTRRTQRLTLDGSLAVLEQVCRSRPAGPLVVCVGEGAGPDEWRNLSRLSGVTVIKITDNCDAWLDHFSTPVVDNEGVLRWPFPHLQAINFYEPSFDDRDAILNMVHSRRGHFVGQGLPMELPTALKTVARFNWIDGVELDMDVALGVTVPDGTVLWEEEAGFGSTVETESAAS